MSTYFAILTKVGETKLASATALGSPLKFTQMGVGDGNGDLPVPIRTQKTLIHEVRRADLNQLKVDPVNANQIIAEQVLPENVGGWWMREIGIYDEDGDLCAVANCPPSYKPQLAEGSGRTQIVRVVLIVASTAAIELKIDPGVVLATRGYVDDLVIDYAAPKDHRHRVSEILPGGLVQQVLRKKSNTSGDVEWVDLTEGVAINVDTLEESQLLEADQTVIKLSLVTTNGIVVHIGGGRLDRDRDFTVDAPARLTLARSYPKGTRITLSQNEPAGTIINPLDASRNLSDVDNIALARKNLGAAMAITGVPLMWPTLDCPTWAVVRNGAALTRSVYVHLYSILCPLRSGTITRNAAGAVITGLSRTSDLWVGMPAEYDHLPAGTTIKAIDSTSQVTVTENAVAAAAGVSLRFFLYGYGAGGDPTTFGVPDDRGLFERGLDSGSRGYEKTIITGKTTLNSKVITGIESTRGLFIGQSLSASAAIRTGAVITAIGASVITMSLASPQAGTVAITVTGGQIGNERADDFKSHQHALSQVNVSNYAGNGDVASRGLLATPAGVQNDLTWGTGGAETRPRFRSYLPIIIY